MRLRHGAIGWASPGTLVLAAALALGLGACDRRTEPFDPSERPRQPDLSRISRPERDPLGLMQKQAQATPPAAQRGAPPVGGSADPTADAEPVRGTVVLADELAGRTPAGATLFIIARLGPGPPLAVKRVVSPTFPYTFELGPGDRMIQAMPFEGPMQITARLDTDGNATTRSPGDLQGGAGAPVNPGASGIVLRLSEGS